MVFNSDHENYGKINVFLNFVFLQLNIINIIIWRVSPKKKKNIAESFFKRLVSNSEIRQKK